MQFNHLAKVFNEIEVINSRNEITKLLSELYSKADPIEARIISYLTLGTLNPPYIFSQFNFATKSALKVAAQLLDLPENEVKEKYNKSGDIGNLVLDGNYHANKHLQIIDVYKRLKDIEKISGIGSQEIRFDAVLSLLKDLDPLSAKYILRILTATLRLGFSDMTIIDALSWMLIGDKSLKTKIENQYNLCADLGLIAYNLKEHGIEGISKAQIQVGIPIRMAGAERLPTAQDIFQKLGPCVAQPKLDGFRLQIHIQNKSNDKFIKLFSRNLIDMSHMFPDLIEALKHMNVENIICEGEAITFDPNTGNYFPFQETAKRKRKHDIESVMQDLPLKLSIFDVLYLNDASLLNLTHEQRRENLIHIIEQSKDLSKDIVNVIPEVKINSAQELENFFLQSIDSGLEGLVIKRPDAIYQPGKRNFNWIKMKRQAKGELSDTVDCVILGYYYGTGRRTKFGIGSFLVGVYNKEKDLFQSLAKVGSGLTDQGLIDLKQMADKIKADHQPNNVQCDKALTPNVWLYPEIVCEIFADEITLSPVHTAGKKENTLGFALRFPRIINYRPEKSATQTTSIKELQEMYQIQYKK